MTKYIIYKISCKDENVTYCYIGSTKNFRVRKSNHKAYCNSDCSKKHNLKVYQEIRANGGWDNWEMKPIEEFECENTLQCRIREQQLIDIENTKLNSSRAHITNEEKQLKKNEWKRNSKSHHDYNKEYNKHLTDAQKERRKETARIRWALNKDKINEKRREKAREKRLNDTI
jgi:hypothetical protein